MVFFLLIFDFKVHLLSCTCIFYHFYDNEPMICPLFRPFQESCNFLRLDRSTIVAKLFNVSYSRVYHTYRMHVCVCMRVLRSRRRCATAGEGTNNRASRSHVLGFFSLHVLRVRSEWERKRRRRGPVWCVLDRTMTLREPLRKGVVASSTHCGRSKPRAPTTAGVQSSHLGSRAARWSGATSSQLVLN